MTRATTVRAGLLVCLLTACAGTPTPAPATAPTDPVAELEPAPPPEPEPQMAIEGLSGSIDAATARQVLEPRNADFAECFAEHGRRLSMVAGRVELDFDVTAEGEVSQVLLRDSTVGHRGIERCIVEKAGETRFPPPNGRASAELSWPLELSPPEGVRVPVTWEPSRIERVVRRWGPRIVERCRPEESRAAIKVTTYVARSGRIVSAGAVAPEPDFEEPLDCVAREVRRWRLPRHRDYLAKVSFELR